MLDYDITIGDRRGCHQDMQRRRNMLLLSGLPFPLSYRGQRPLARFFFSGGISLSNNNVCPTFFASLPCINLVSWHTTFEFSTAERKILCECIMPVSSTFIIILSTHSNFCFYIKSNSFTFAHTTSSQTATRTTQITMEMR